MKGNLTFLASFYVTKIVRLKEKLLGRHETRVRFFFVVVVNKYSYEKENSEIDQYGIKVLFSFFFYI